MRAILVNLVQLGGMQIVIALTAIVRNKVLAVRLGTSGYGEFSQIALVAVSVSVLVAFGLSLSLNRNVAATPERAERQRLLSQANGVNLSLTALFVLIVIPTLLLRPAAVGLVELDPRRAVLVSLLVLLVYIPLDAAVKHRVAFLTAVLDIAGMTSGRSLALGVGTVVTLPLVWFFGLVGAAAQLTLLTATILVFLDRRCRRIGYRPWAIAFEWRLVRFLAGFGIASLAAGFAQQFSDLIVRSFLIRSIGTAENGIFQSALSITYQVRAVVLGSVGSYSIATLSQDSSRDKVIDTANRLLTAVLPIATLALGLLGLLSGPAILILYSKAFLPAQAVLPFLLSTDYLRVAIWVLGAPLLADNRVRTWLVLELVSTAVRTITAVILLERVGIVGVALGFAAAIAFHLLLTGAYYLRVFRYTVKPTNIVLFIVGGVLMMAVAVAGSRVVIDLRTQGIGLAVLLIYALVCLHLIVGMGPTWRRLTMGLRRRLGS